MTGDIQRESVPEKDELEELAELLDSREQQGETPLVCSASQASLGGEPSPAGEASLAAGVASPRSHTFAEVCSLLNLSPYALRGMLSEYGELLGLSADGEDLPAGQRCLSDWSFRLLREAVTLRAAGLGRAEIKDRLRALQEAAAGLALVPGYGRGEGTTPWALRHVDRGTARDLLLIEKIEQLAEQVARSEEKRIDDRDRLLMALVRTQQEVQQLRYELLARSRRERKRRGFWARLFGR